MCDPASPDASLEDLRKELIRLQNDLAETTTEKVQAAEYGLVVLEEKERLQQQLEDIEAHYYNVKAELECAKEVNILCTQYF